MNIDQITSVGTQTCAHVFLGACSYSISVQILALMAVSNLSVIIAATVGLCLVMRPWCIPRLDRWFAQKVQFLRHASTVERLLDIGLSAVVVGSNVFASGWLLKTWLAVQIVPIFTTLITTIPWKGITNTINNYRVISTYVLTLLATGLLLAASFYTIVSAALAVMNISSKLLSLVGSLVLTVKCIELIRAATAGKVASLVTWAAILAATVYGLGATYLAGCWLAVGTIAAITSFVQMRRIHNLKTTIESWIQEHPEHRDLAKTIATRYVWGALFNNFTCDFGGAAEIPELDYGAFRIVEFINYQGEQLPTTLTQSTKLIKLKLTRCDNIQPSTLKLAAVNVPDILQHIDLSSLDQLEVSSSTLPNENNQNNIPLRDLSQRSLADKNLRWLERFYFDDRFFKLRWIQHPLQLWLSSSTAAVQLHTQAVNAALELSDDTSAEQDATGTAATSSTYATCDTPHLIRDITTKFSSIKTAVQQHSSQHSYIFQTPIEDIDNSLDNMYHSLQLWQQNREQGSLQAYSVSQLRNNCVTVREVNDELELSTSEEGAIIELAPRLRSIIALHCKHDRGMLMSRTIGAVHAVLTRDLALEKARTASAMAADSQNGAQNHLDALNDPITKDNVLEKFLVVRDESEPAPSAASSSEQKLPLSPTKHEMVSAFQVLIDNWLRPTPVMQLHELIQFVPKVFSA